MSFILTGPDCCYRKLFEVDLSRHGLRPKIALETSSIQLIKQMTLCGMGICLLPQIAVADELACSSLVQLRYSFPYHIVSEFLYHKDKWISPALQDFMDFVNTFTA
jgi:DNA-binding transcriptional LysR family regulator